VKKRNFRLVSIFIIIILSVVSLESAATETQSNIISSLSESIQLKHWQIAIDAEPQNTPQFPADSLWQLVGPSLDIDEYNEGNWILRTNIVISDSLNSNFILGIFPINFVTAYEIYWDGVKIAQNGELGINKTDEKAGRYDFNIALPPDLETRGEHTLILRISNHNNYSSWKWLYGDIIIGNYNFLLKKIFRFYYQAFFVIGILFIPFLFNLFLYIGRKRKTEHLLFSLICFIVILDSATFLVPTLIDTGTTFVYWEYFTYRLITILFTILFPAFFIYLFSFPKIIIGLILAINLIIYIFFANPGNVFNLMTVTVLIISTMITIWALYKRQEESIIIFIGLIAAWAAYFFSIAFAGLATTMVICTSFSIARQFAKKEQTEKDAQLKSANLENDLLRKNINPHFILNTLTSVIVWLRKDPNSAIKLIEALAEEFRMINQISALKQISIQQEIDLCKTHLKIMSYRKGADYKMETLDVDVQDTIPPMIFHTLVENGLTHGYENKTSGTFKLRRIKNSDYIQYILSNDGDFNSDESKGSTGFGAKYIKGRLEESYPNRWKFISNKLPQGWESFIEIRNA
jgi:sensor histidine kinase YesM